MIGTYSETFLVLSEHIKTSEGTAWKHKGMNKVCTVMGLYVDAL